MSCSLTGGRLKPCKDATGGIRRVHFVDYGSIGTASFGTDDEITDLDGTFDYHTYEIKGSSSLTTNITSSAENGTTFFEQVLELTLPKLTKKDNKELKVLIYGQPHAFVEDYRGNVWAVGIENGCDVTGGTAVTGAEMGDLNGYTLSITAKEIYMPNFVEGATSLDPFAGCVSATATQSTQSDPA